MLLYYKGNQDWRLSGIIHRATEDHYGIREGDTMAATYTDQSGFVFILHRESPAWNLIGWSGDKCQVNNMHKIKYI